MRRNPVFALACALVFLAPAVASAQPRVAHPWHGVDPGYDAKDNAFRAVIEIPRGSKNKYEIDKPTGLLKLDRVLRSDDGYPADYGFIPQSYGHDGDPLDVLVISSHPVAPLAIVDARAIGVLKMIDQGEGDDKILAVNPSDPVYGKITDISQLPQAKLDEIEHFFKTYKLREGKTVEVEKPEGPEVAKKIIEESFVDYEKLQAKNAAEEAAKEKAEAKKAGVIASFFGKAGDFLKAGFDRLSSLFVRAKASDVKIDRPSDTRGMSDALSERIAESTRVGVDKDGR